MISKVKEMAVFSIGIGVIIIAITIFWTFVMPLPPGQSDTDYLRFAVLLVPGAVACGLGIWILLSRSAFAVETTTIVLGALFLIAGLIPPNVPTLAFGVLVVAVMWPAQNKALEEIKNGGVPVPKSDNRSMTEENPFQ